MFITYALNVSYESKEQNALITSIIYGSCILMFGNINNGGHFNPIVTLGILIQ